VRTIGDRRLWNVLFGCIVDHKQETWTNLPRLKFQISRNVQCPMLGLDSISLLLEWCTKNSVLIDPRLRIDFDEHGGLGVFSTENAIPQDATRMFEDLFYRRLSNALDLVVRIAKDSVLSTRSCSLADYIPPVPYGLGAQIALSLALYGEM
jgi:hypothetical protein